MQSPFPALLAPRAKAWDVALDESVVRMQNFAVFI